MLAGWDDYSLLIFLVILLGEFGYSGREEIFYKSVI